MLAEVDRGGMKDIPRPVEGDPRCRPIAIKFDIQRCGVCRKCETWRNMVVPTEGVIESAILFSNCELRPNLNFGIIWNLGHVPCSIALWVSVIATLLGSLRAVQVPVEVHLLSRIVLVDVLP